MQEMHHRVKNNLQQIASLIRLQIRHGAYKTLEEALTDTLARILAISTVHDLLSRGDLDHVSMRSLADQLVQHQQASFLLPNRQIRFLVRGDDVYLTTNQATQVALILNELIQNAIEHGFEHIERGEIHINIEEHSSDVGIWVSNNGDRLPADFNMGATKSLGLQIVNSLTQSLRGTFKLEDIWGWAVAEVKFQRQGSE
jgi:two-component sensor histidine kinase